MDTLKLKKEISCCMGCMVKMSAIPFQSCDDRFYCFIRFDFTFELLDCDCYISQILLYCGLLKRVFVPTVTLAGLKNVNLYIRNIVLSKIIISGSTVI